MLGDRAVKLSYLSGQPDTIRIRVRDPAATRPVDTFRFHPDEHRVVIHAVEHALNRERVKVELEVLVDTFLCPRRLPGLELEYRARVRIERVHETEDWHLVDNEIEHLLGDRIASDVIHARVVRFEEVSDLLAEVEFWCHELFDSFVVFLSELVRILEPHIDRTVREVWLGEIKW